MIVVYYFVIGADGNRYGPADIDLLVHWAREGRIVGSTTLIERGTERQVRADSITAITAALSRLSTPAAGVAVDRRDLTSSELPTVTGLAHTPPPPPPQSSHLSPLVAQRSSVSLKSKLAAGLLGILFGGIGAHRFYLGYTGIGMLMLLFSLLGSVPTLGVSCGLVWIWGFIEGIICLCGGMSDAEGRPLRD